MESNVNSLPFTYKVEVAVVAGVGSTGSANLIMQADSNFELSVILGTGSLAAEATEVAPNKFALQIRDQTTGRDLMSGPIPQRVMCGNAFNQFLQRRPVVFLPQSNILFTVTNLDASAQTVTIALHGYKQIL
jgi:hypothetical protein